MLKDDELIGAISDLSSGSAPLHRQADRAREELRRSSRHRHREYAAAQRIARSRWSSRQPPRTCCASSVPSPGELEPVFHAMLENATRICEAKFGVSARFDDDDASRRRGMHNAPPALAEFRRRNAVRFSRVPQSAPRRVLIATKAVSPYRRSCGRSGYAAADPRCRDGRTWRRANSCCRADAQG